MDEIVKPFLCLPLAVDARWLPIPPARSEPTSDPRKKAGVAALVLHAMGKKEEEEWRGGLV